MKPDEFRQWRKSLGWKQKDAAERLGLKKRVIQYYEKGHRDGKAVAIPTSVELACLAIALGHEVWDAEVAAGAIKSRAEAAAPGDEPPVEAVAALDAEPSVEAPTAEAQAFAEGSSETPDPGDTAHHS